MSLGGRIILIQSCLSHIPSYFLSLFKVPTSIALRIEKLKRDFLWLGFGEGKRDHLVSWDMVCKLKESSGLGFWKISLRNQALLSKWLWRYPKEGFALWHQVILSIYGTHSNGWDTNNIIRWSHHCPWKANAHILQVFSTHTCFVVGDGTKICFWDDLWWGDQPLCLQFPKLFRVSTTKTCPISTILGNNTSLSWDLVFKRNLTDVEIVDLERLMSLLSPIHLTSSVLDVKAWVSFSLRFFSVKLFFAALSNVSNYVSFYLTNFLWKSKVPFKVRAFAWLVTHKKVNTNDILQMRRPFEALSLDWCILCRRSIETIDHLFLHYLITMGLWHRIFSQLGMEWVQPGSICDMMVISLKCFGNSIRCKILWRIACLSLLWIVWRERHARIFGDIWKTLEMMWG